MNRKGAVQSAEVETDVCIVGGGPAGVTIATELANEPFRVLVLESGGAEYSEAAHALTAGEANPAFGMRFEDTRRRQLYGSASCWNIALPDGEIGVRCGTLDEIDFERRPWLEMSGWPFTKAALDPYYRRAQSAWSLGDYAYDVGAGSSGRAALPLDGTVVTTGLWRYARPRLLKLGWRDRISRAANVTTHLNANVVEVETDETGTRATGVRVARFDGPPYRVRAKVVVLAGGGIENPRLLLMSNRVHRTGLGNEADLVGRFFMEHQLVRAGTFVPASRALFDGTALYDIHDAGDAHVMGMLRLTPELMRRERLLNVSASLLPRPRFHDRVSQEAVNALAELVREARRFKVPRQAARKAAFVLRHADYVALAGARKVTGRRDMVRSYLAGPDAREGAGWSELPGNARRYVNYEVVLYAEQLPDPDNRITLDASRVDAFGSPSPRLEWQWRDVDRDSVLRASRLLARELERAGVGRLRVDEPAGGPVLLSAGCNHHMGTTRMDEDPKRGVVDADCRVHGTANVYVAGSSVFATGGHINPTLTIVALAMRLADHLKSGLRRAEAGASASVRTVHSTS